MTGEQEAILGLYGVPGVGAKTYAMLVARFGSAAAVFDASDSELHELPGVGDVLLRNIRSFDRGTFVAEQARLMDEASAALIVRGGDGYPPMLDRFPSAPPVLFVRGDASVLAKDAVAIVGTRAATAYGERLARRIAGGLAEAGFVVTSGMADGIDTFAHSATLEAGGETVAVFGCGVDVIYPKRNESLSRKIAQSGCLMSHFPMGTLGMPGNFPARNAVVVGLSRATVVVEAGMKSGALITADLTLRAKRPLFAVPGDADHPKSKGPNALFAKGARPVTGPGEILDALGSPAERTSRRNAGPMPKGRAGKITALLSEGDFTPDEIAERLNLPVRDVLTDLTLLAIEGLVVKSGASYSRK